MTDLLKRIVQVIAFALIALIGLGMALIFTFSTLIAVAILFVAAKLRGQRFSVQEYWTSRQAKRKPIFQKGNFGQPSQRRDNVTDVEARDVR